MKNRVLSALSLIVLGVLIAIGPQHLFEVCEAMGDTHMRCFYTARAEIGIGGLIAVLGILHLFTASKQIRLGLSLAAALAGLLTVLLPSVLIGMCGMASMQCRFATLPALTVLGILTTVFSAFNALFLYRQIRKAKETAL